MSRHKHRHHSQGNGQNHDQHRPQQSSSSQPPQSKPPVVDNDIDSTEPMSGKWIIITLAIAVVIASSWLIYKKSRGGNEAPAPLPMVIEDISTSTKSYVDSQRPVDRDKTVPANGATVTAADQPAGSTVKVTGMSFNKPSWVAVRDAKTHRILGARRFVAGTKEGEVILLRPTEKGNTYEAVLYAENGDSTFDPHTDIQVTGMTVSFIAL